MRYSSGLLPLVGSLASLLEAKPLSQPSLTFASLGQISSESAHNVAVEYFGDVDGELALTYGSCVDALISGREIW